MRLYEIVRDWKLKVLLVDLQIAMVCALCILYGRLGSRLVKPKLARLRPPRIALHLACA